MKFICEKALLETAIAPLSKVVSTKTTLPILENILVEVSADGVRFASTDLEIGMKTLVPAKVEESGITTVPARVFFEVVSHLNEGLIEVQLDSEANMVILKGDGCQYKFNVLSADGYPVLPETPKETKISISQEIFKKLLRDTLFAASSPREDNLIFTGLLFKLENGTLTLVGLDGHRLAKREINLPKSELTKSIIIPARALNELLKILKETPDPVEIYIGEHQVVFKLGETIFFTRLLEGQFPQYQSIIPKKSENCLKVDKESFIQSLRRASILAQERESPKLIKMSLRGNKLVITANTQDLGQAYEEIPVEIVHIGEMPEITIGFNARYLIEALSVVEKEKVRFEFGQAKNPGVIRPEIGEDAVYVVMPVRPLGEVVAKAGESEGRPLAAAGRKS